MIVLLQFLQIWLSYGLTAAFHAVVEGSMG